MRKKYYGYFVAALIGLFVIIPWAIGLIFSKHYDHMVENIASNLHMNAKVIAYKEGIFSSEAIIAVNYPLADNPLPASNLDRNNALMIDQKIYHGPLIIAFAPKFKIHPGFAYITSNVADKTFAATHISLANKLTSYFNLDEYAFKDTMGNIRYAIKGLNGYFDIDSTRTKFLAKIQIKNIIANLTQPRIIEDFRISANLTKNNDLWVGDSTYHFGKLYWQQDDAYYMFSDFNHSLHSAVTSNDFTATIKDNVRNVSIDGANLGQQEINLSLDHIKAVALKQLQEAFPLAKAHLATAVDRQQAQQLLISLLNQGGQFKLGQLILHTQHGDIYANGHVTIPENIHAKQFGELFSKADRNLVVKIPNTLANKMLRSIYPLISNSMDQQAAQDFATKTLLDWQRSGWLITAGQDLWIKISKPNRYAI